MFVQRSFSKERDNACYPDLVSVCRINRAGAAKEGSSEEIVRGEAIAIAIICDGLQAMDDADIAA